MVKEGKDLGLSYDGGWQRWNDSSESNKEMFEKMMRDAEKHRL